MASPVILSNTTARHLLLARQGLSVAPTGRLTGDSLLDMITALGFVQIDSIQTVARAHHMILFARNQTYRPPQLTRLLEHDRSLFEHWTHDAAVIPSIFYPYWQHRFQRERAALLMRWRKWQRREFEEVLADVLATVARRGPTLAREFDAKRKKGDGWWDWHPHKAALEFHWRTGALAVAGRAGFQKVYDLTERVISQTHRQETVSEAAFIDWACRQALNRLGVATSGELAAFWGLLSAAETARWCRNRRSDGELVDVRVTAADGSFSKAFAVAGLADDLADLPRPPDRVRILSPFDPLIRDRKRCQRLFGFDYRIEVFVPAAKRRYGYYVFPVLQGDRFIGRIDMKRDNDSLLVSKLWPETGVRMSKGRLAALRAELNRQRRFIGVSDLHFAPDCGIA